MRPGGGAPEAELAMRLRAYASSVGGREQLAIEAFANAMEIIPKTSGVSRAAESHLRSYCSGSAIYISHGKRVL
ncbi:MAG: TCP-1/cpn60 chaperonin family protein [Methanothrix sp.]|nr:TCP-1/cpn60 chaperonin family protein [Methanothrix sp.]